MAYLPMLVNAAAAVAVGVVAGTFFSMLPTSL